MTEEANGRAVVLMPKGVGDYRSIGLVEVLCKVVTVNINCRFTVFVAFHEVLRGFWEGLGTGTASFEAKLLHQLEASSK